jgi:transposase
MDLHRRRSVLVRMTEDGRKLGSVRIASSPAELCKQIARAGKHPKVVLEATCGWYWAADTLAAAGAEVHLAHPLGVKAFTYRRVKDDPVDALAVVRAALREEGQQPPVRLHGPVLEVRRLSDHRADLVAGRTRVINRLRRRRWRRTCRYWSPPWPRSPYGRGQAGPLARGPACPAVRSCRDR